MKDFALALLVVVVIAVMSLSVTAQGQTLYQAGPKGCPVFANQVQAQIQATRAEYPADWRIIVACTD